MRRSDPEDFSLRWQAFLIDGFEDWLPLATIAASNMVKANPRDILKSMISDFYFPEGITQTTDDIAAWMEGFAQNSNAIVRDPKTGEAIGRMREFKKGADGTLIRIAPEKQQSKPDKFKARKEQARQKRAEAINRKLVNGKR